MLFNLLLFLKGLLTFIFNLLVHLSFLFLSQAKNYLFFKELPLIPFSLA